MSSDNSGKGEPETKQHHKGIITYRHFQLRYMPRGVFEPCDESTLTPQGILLELFLLQQRVAKQNSLALETRSALAPQSLISSSVFIIGTPFGRPWEGL